MPNLRFVSPERRLRAGSLALLAAWFIWRTVRYAGPYRPVNLAAGILVAACLLAFVAPVMRSCLIVTDEGLVDRRAVRSVRLAWGQVAEFRVARPGGPWGGFCVVVNCRDGTEVDLLSTRAYSRAPFAHHLDDLQRISWTLEERRAARIEEPPADLFLLRRP